MIFKQIEWNKSCTWTAAKPCPRLTHTDILVLIRPCRWLCLTDRRNGMWWNHMPKIFLHWLSKPGWSRTNNHWMRLTTNQCWLVWWSTSPLITVQQDLHHLLSWRCEVLVACWNSHSRTRAWLAFHKICTGWHSMISVVQCPQTMIKSLHHHHHTRWEQLLFISF